MAIIRFLFRFLLFAFIAIVVVGFALPDKAHIQRSININAPIDKVFAQVNSMQKFYNWSPWSQGNTDLRYGFEGPESGVGSKLSWRNESLETGDGHQVITRSINNRLVETRIDFSEDNTGTAQFELSSNDDSSTRLTWHFRSEFGWDLFSRYIGLMLDSMIGASYEKGLATLKRQMESE